MRKGRCDKAEFFLASDGWWYWHLRSANGKIVADGAEGYTRKADAQRAYRTARMIAARCTHAEEV